MTSWVVARRYAKGLFELASQGGAEECNRAGKDLDAFAALAAENTDIARLFRDPVFSREEKRAVITALAGRLESSGMVRDFLYLLADKNRLMFLSAIAAAYQALLDVKNGVLRGSVVSAVPLSDKAREDVRTSLEKKAGRALILDFTVDASLLGGMLLRVGDTIMDASLKTQLSLLKDTIKQGA